jgi:hypothetical protein
MEEQLEKLVKEEELKEEQIDKLIYGLPETNIKDKEKYIPFTQTNYDINSGDIPIEKINTMLPEDYTLIEDKYGTNTFLAYSPKNNELILSYKGSTSITDWREDFETLGTNLLGARITQGEVMIDVAERYNDLKDDPNRKKQFTEKLKSFKKNVVAGYDKLANFIKKNELEDLPFEDRPKIKILGHSLGSARAIGTLEMIEHTNFKDGKPLYNYFDVESNVYNSAPYPVNDAGDFYFLNDKMRLNVYSLGFYVPKERRPLTEPIRRVDDLMFRPLEIIARPFQIGSDAIFGEQKKALDNGRYYQLEDFITGIPDITRTMKSTYQPQQNYNFDIISKRSRARDQEFNIFNELKKQHTTKGLYNPTQYNKRNFILREDEIPLKPILTQEGFKNIIDERNMKRHKIIPKRPKQQQPIIIDKIDLIDAEGDELFIRNQAGYIPFLSNISLEEYCKLNSNSAECKSFCANNPKSCDFTDF